MVSAALMIGTGCSKAPETAEPQAANCAPTDLSSGGGSTGTARAFMPDPLVDSGNPALSPNASNLDSYAHSVDLKNLVGNGVLKGKYVDVRNGDACGLGYGAYDASNQFVYAHSDTRFQEAMAYFWGDAYRQRLDGTGYLQAGGPVQILAHCPQQENAFFYKAKDSAGSIVERVCLGYSAATAGAYYADDATVTIHELEHATTTDTYAPSPSGHLNQLWYDEAGALNEAVSDFMALIFERPYLGNLDPTIFDPKLFSRWALGTFVPNHPATRGAHRCPAYDPTYPSCSSYPSFSAANNTISYVYPDGMGWPYANTFEGPGYAASAFSSYKSQEEIHNAGVLLEGALWDAYDAVKSAHGGDETAAGNLLTQLVLEAIKHLPQPSLTASPPVLSPVGFQGFAAKMVQYAAAVGLSSADQTALSAVLTARGLIGGTQLSSSWLAVGPGNSGVTPGLRVQDNPTLLKTWLTDIFGDPTAADLVPQGLNTGLNSKLDPGELAVVWFDLQNVDATTAGDVQVTITSLDPEITIDETTNIGWISNTQAQMIYGKVNGTSIVTALTSANATYNVGTGNSYFRTNPFFDRSWNTAVWVKVRSSAAHGATVRFQVQAQPSNGAASTATFTATIN